MEQNQKLKEAVRVLIKELKSDKDYREAWKSNIAVAFQDEFKNFSENRGRNEAVDNIHFISNEAADRFLEILCINSD